MNFLKGVAGNLNSFKDNLSVTLKHEEFTIGSYNLLVTKRIAEGGFGFIDLVQDANTKSNFVLKRCAIQNEEQINTVKKEVNCLRKFKGQYVVQCLESDIQMREQGQEALILLELCPGGHLLDMLLARNGQPLNTSEVMRIFGQILLGLKPLYNASPPLVHRDLKLENILLGVDGNIRLCDFGSCCEARIPLRDNTERAAAEELIGKETTQIYRAPEMIDLHLRDELTEKTDIWALGCIFYTLCFLLHPFQDAGSLAILNAKLNIPASLGPDVVYVMNRLIHVSLI